MAEPLPASVPAPRLAPGDVVAADLCIGCGGCGPKAGALGWDRFGQLKPAGAWTAEPSAAFARTCPFSPSAADEDAIAAARFPAAPERDARIGRFERAYVGHVAEDGFREGGSSGGLVTWVAAELIRRGLVDGVAHVSPRDPAENYSFNF